MAAHVNIRRFVRADVAQLTVAFNEINGTVGTERENDVDFMRRYLSQPSYSGEDNAYVAHTGDQLIGFAVVFPELRIGRTVASGGVLVPYRGRGAGRMLLRRSVEHARGLGRTSYTSRPRPTTKSPGASSALRRSTRSARTRP